MVSHSQLDSPGLVISAPYLKAVCSCHDWARNHRVLIVISAPTTHSHHAPLGSWPIQLLTAEAGNVVNENPTEGGSFYSSIN